MKNVPWGICGLIVEIYNRTMQRALQKKEDVNVLFDSVKEAMQAEGKEETEPIDFLDNSGKVGEVAENLFAANPGLRQRIEEQIWVLVVDFEDELMKGNIVLELTSAEEMILPIQRIVEETRKLEQIPASEELQQQTSEAMRQAITDIMTPERYRQFRNDVEKTAETWIRTRHKWAAALKVELTFLDEDHYEVNKFILVVFLSQIRRRRQRRRAHGLLRRAG